MRVKLVCFDLDDTLVLRPDSVTYLCALNGRAGEKGGSFY